MGGRLDATNVVQNTLLAILTSISFDHRKVLGNSLEEIATEKSGIIKKGSAVIALKGPEEVMKVLRQAALLRKAKFFYGRRRPGKKYPLRCDETAFFLR